MSLPGHKAGLARVSKRPSLPDKLNASAQERPVKSKAHLFAKRERRQTMSMPDTNSILGPQKVAAEPEVQQYPALFGLAVFARTTKFIVLSRTIF